MSASAALPDWRDAGAYRDLLTAERSAFAWEWLRRDPQYRAAAVRVPSKSGEAAAGRCDEAARPWALHRFEDPALAAPYARPVWRSGPSPLVLRAITVRSDDLAASFDLSAFAHLATLIGSASGSEHLLLSDGLRSVRIDIAEGSLLAGPVGLRFHLPDLAHLDAPLLVLRRFLHLFRTGRFSAGLHRRESRAGRWILALRAYDALSAGAAQRAIAQYLLSADAGAPRWRVEVPALRSSAQRLVREARRMAAGGFWNLLRGE